jgi:hypothetical protein
LEDAVTSCLVSAGSSLVYFIGGRKACMLFGDWIKSPWAVIIPN